MSKYDVYINVRGFCGGGAAPVWVPLAVGVPRHVAAIYLETAQQPVQVRRSDEGSVVGANYDA